MTQNPLFEGMLERLEKSKERLANAHRLMQAAQAEFQAASSEHTVWNSAIGLLAREEERLRTESNQKQIPMDLPGLEQVAAQPAPQQPIQSTESRIPVVQSAVVANKTEKVREVLRANEHGLSTGSIWLLVRDYFTSRAYLYAVLKRLRDSDEVCVRRGKYVLKAKPDGIKGGTQGEMMLQ